MEQKRSHETKKTTMTPPLILQMVMVSLTGVVISVNENYGTLIPALQHDLGIDGGQVTGLLSTAFFVGMVSTSLLGGLLADRSRTRSLMLGSLMVMTASQMLLPFPPAFVSPLAWMTALRCIVGLGGGLAFVSGTRAMSTLGKFEGLGQGVFGAASMLGPALSLFITPYLLERFGWRGAFFSWGVVTCAAYVLWSWMPSDQAIHRGTISQGLAFAAFRSPLLWCLGLTFMGTAGWGNAVFSWLAAGRVGILEVDPNQTLPSYLSHISLHLTGLVNAPGHTTSQQQIATKVDKAVQAVTVLMQHIRQDAIQLVKMSNTELQQTKALSLLNDMVTNTNTAYVGQQDPTTGQAQGGVTWIHGQLQLLAAVPINTATPGQQ